MKRVQLQLKLAEVIIQSSTTAQCSVQHRQTVSVTGEAQPIDRATASTKSAPGIVVYLISYKRDD